MPGKISAAGGDKEANGRNKQTLTWRRLRTKMRSDDRVITNWIHLEL